jgi:hypothetical protein
MWKVERQIYQERRRKTLSACLGQERSKDALRKSMK